MRNGVRWPGVVASLLFLTACGGNGPTAPSLATLQGVWHLVSLQRAGQAAVTVPAGVTMSVEFRTDGHVTVAADCNRCNATYEAHDSRLSVGIMACTRAFCASAPLDTDFTELLGDAQEWSIMDEQLVLRSPSGSLRLSQ